MRSTHSQKVFVAVDLAIIVTLPFFFILFFSRFQSHWSVLLSPFQFRIVVDEYDMAYTVVCIASHRTTSTKSKSNWSIRDSILARLNWQLRWKKKKKCRNLSWKCVRKERSRENEREKNELAAYIMVVSSWRTNAIRFCVTVTSSKASNSNDVIISVWSLQFVHSFYLLFASHSVTPHAPRKFVISCWWNLATRSNLFCGFVRNDETISNV